MGVHPLRKDLLLEYARFDDSSTKNGESEAQSRVVPHSHHPTAATVGPKKAAFAEAPVTLPDGTTGINVIDGYGQGGLFIGGTFIADADGDGVIAGNVFGADFQTFEAVHLAATLSTPGGESPDGPATGSGHELDRHASPAARPCLTTADPRSHAEATLRIVLEGRRPCRRRRTM